MTDDYETVISKSRKSDPKIPRDRDIWWLGVSYAFVAGICLGMEFMNTIARACGG